MLTIILSISSVIVNVFIITVTVLIVYRYLFCVMSHGRIGKGLLRDSFIFAFVIFLLFSGHIIQIAVWAILFMLLGEFKEFSTSMYYSMVNFSSLGYGDIVMSPRWRLLGSMEAVIGILMFGVSTAVLVDILRRIFRDRLRGMHDRIIGNK